MWSTPAISMFQAKPQANQLSRVLKFPAPRPQFGSHDSVHFAGGRRKGKVDPATGFSPIEAVSVDFEKIKFPVIISTKVDGNRGIVQNGQVIGRSLLPVPNPTVQKILARPELEGFDGELISGNPTDNDLCNKTTAFMQKKRPVGDNFAYMVFDLWNEPDKTFEERLTILKKRYAALPKELKKHVKLMPQIKVSSQEEILKHEKQWVNKDGYEGVVIRSANAPYINQRSTMADQAFMKLKRFEDAEAKIIGFHPLKAKPALIQSLIEEGQIPADTATDLKTIDALGGYQVQDLKTKAKFNLGVGKINIEERITIWKNRAHMLGKIVKYKFFPKGVNPETQVPRHPVFLGIRADHDMPAALKAIAEKLDVTAQQANDDAETA